MASQGPNSPNTGADDSSIGTVAWSNPGNVVSSNNVRATANLAASAISHYVKATGFGFSIPSLAVINGIVVEVERNALLRTDSIKDESVRLVKGGTISGSDQPASVFWPDLDAYRTYGSSSDLWGLSWTAADVNASNFGVVVAAKNWVASTDQAQIDHIRITIYYTDIEEHSDSDSGTGTDSESTLDIEVYAESDSGAGTDDEATLDIELLTDSDSGAGTDAESLEETGLTLTVIDLGALTLHTGALTLTLPSGTLDAQTLHSGQLPRRIP